MFKIGMGRTVRVGFVNLEDGIKSWNIFYDYPPYGNRFRKEQLSASDRDRRKAFNKLRLRVRLNENKSAAKVHKRIQGDRGNWSSPTVDDVTLVTSYAFGKIPIL